MFGERRRSGPRFGAPLFAGSGSSPTAVEGDRRPVQVWGRAGRHRLRSGRSRGGRVGLTAGRVGPAFGGRPQTVADRRPRGRGRKAQEAAASRVPGAGLGSGRADTRRRSARPLPGAPAKQTGGVVTCGRSRAPRPGYPDPGLCHRRRFPRADFDALPRSGVYANRTVCVRPPPPRPRGAPPGGSFPTRSREGERGRSG